VSKDVKLIDRFIEKLDTILKETVFAEHSDPGMVMGVAFTLLERAASISMMIYGLERNMGPESLIEPSEALCNELRHVVEARLKSLLGR
jgi:hypothetical protein